MQVRGTPKNFQGVERKKKTTPAVRRAPSAPKNFQGAERQKQFTPAERRAPSAGRRAPGAERPFFGRRQYSSQIIPTRP